MAAVTEEQQDSPMRKSSDQLKEKVSQRNEEILDDLGEQEDYGLEFLEKEQNDILKSSRNVCELLEKIREETEALEEQVGTVCSSVPPKVAAALSAEVEVRYSLDELLQREKRISNRLQQHLQGTKQWMKDLGQTCNHVDFIERSMKYLKCLHHIEELSAAVQQSLMINSVWDAIKGVESMAALDCGLSQSQCSHLCDFLRKTLCFWHSIIKDRLTSDFEKVLAQLQWPVITPNQSVTLPANHQELSSQLEGLLLQLLALQTSDDLISQRASASTQGAPPGSSSTLSPAAPPLCLPIQIMLQPLTKRFRYHFYGNRQTNSIHKPEWYLTQVLKWMENSAAFMEEKIQPVFERSGQTISAKVALCQGLVCLVQEKVASDASRMLYDDGLFCHLVEEVLQFEKDLRSHHSYPAMLPALLHILLDDAFLQKWLAVERKNDVMKLVGYKSSQTRTPANVEHPPHCLRHFLCFSLRLVTVAVEKMDAMLSAEGAWTSQYKDISDMDELKAPECAETFMTLLQVITERYRALPSPAAQLRFFGLQKELVDDFRIRLTQVMKEESRCPLGVRYCAILNAVNYISTILRDWGDNVFFLQLQQAAVSLRQQEVLGSLEMTEVGRLASLEGSLFDGLLSLLDRLKGDMLGRLLQFLMRDTAEKAQLYCQERWLSIPPPQDQSTMSLSGSACSMMLCVRDRLLNLHQVLSVSLFQLAWQGFAEKLDNFIYQEVILSNHFSDGGAAQLQFDMTRNLFPLFGHYCRRPENFFKHVKEACIILCLKVGSAILLKDLLKRSEQKTTDFEDPSPESALNELGVFCLAPCDVLILLNLKASLPGMAV